MSDPVGEWQNQTGFGFENKAKRHQLSVSKKAALGRHTHSRCQRIDVAVLWV